MAVLDGKSVVVTGAGRGLGRAYAELAAREGARVVVNDVDGDAAEETTAAIRKAGGEAQPSADDISTWEGAGRTIGLAVESFGCLDGLVSNAGLFHLATPEEEDPARVRAIVEVNVMGPMFCGLHALRAMRPQGSGAIVNVTSGAFAGISAMSIYGATKGAVASLTYGWAVDMANTGIRVNAISPVARSRMYETTLAYRGQADPAAAISTLPEENAAVAIYLLSDEAAGITGQIVRITPPVLSLVTHPDEVQPALSRDSWSVADVARAFDETFRARLQPLGLSAWGSKVVT